MTERFNNFIPFIYKWEDVLDRNGNVIAEHDPDDPGGTTKYGIDAASHPGVDVENLMEQHARRIYFDEWTENGIENLPYKTGEAFFDACVNCGPLRAKKFLAASAGCPEILIDERAAFYRRLAEAKPSLKRFLAGWLNRTRDLRKFLEL